MTLLGRLTPHISAERFRGPGGPVSQRSYRLDRGSRSACLRPAAAREDGMDEEQLQDLGWSEPEPDELDGLTMVEAEA